MSKWEAPLCCSDEKQHYSCSHNAYFKDGAKLSTKDDAHTFDDGRPGIPSQDATHCKAMCIKYAQKGCTCFIWDGVRKRCNLKSQCSGSMGERAGVPACPSGQRGDRNRQKQTETDRGRQKQTETDRDRQRQTETDRHRQKQTDTDKPVRPSTCMTIYLCDGISVSVSASASVFASASVSVSPCVTASGSASVCASVTDSGICDELCS